MLCILIFIFSSVSYALTYPTINSKIVEIYDLTDKKILYEQNSKEIAQIASLTKIATVITAIENIENVDEQVTITWNILNTIDPNASLAGLKGGDKVTYRDLLYASILPSGADATYSIAVLSSGSIDNFVIKMNELASSIGLNETHFSNVTGLHDDNHYSSADDMRKILEYALQNDAFREIYTTKEYELSNGLKVKSTLYTYNISSTDDAKILGSKTGYTKESGYCLSSLSNINGHEMIIISLNASRDGNKFYNITDTISLIDFLNDNFAYRVLVNYGEAIKTIPVKFSDIDSYDIISNIEVSKYLPSDYDKNELNFIYNGKEMLDFRDNSGDRIGTIEYYFGNEFIASGDVILDRDIHLDIVKIIKEYIVAFIIGVVILLFIILRAITKALFQSSKKKRKKMKKR